MLCQLCKCYTSFLFPARFLFFRCLSDFQQPDMEPRYFCTICLKRPAPPFFLKDASSLPSSKVFATCYPCREKVYIQKRKRTALQEIDPNIGLPPAQRRATSISQTPFRSATIDNTRNTRPIPPVQIPVSLVQPPQPLPVQPAPVQLTSVEPAPI